MRRSDPAGSPGGKPDSGDMLQGMSGRRPAAAEQGVQPPPVRAHQREALEKSHHRASDADNRFIIVIVRKRRYQIMDGRVDRPLDDHIITIRGLIAVCI